MLLVLNTYRIFEATYKISNPETCSAFMYSPDVRWSQSESIANLGFASALFIAAKLSLFCAIKVKGEGSEDAGLR